MSNKGDRVKTIHDVVSEPGARVEGMSQKCWDEHVDAWIKAKTTKRRTAVRKAAIKAQRGR